MKTTFSLIISVAWCLLLVAVSPVFGQNWTNPTNFFKDNYTIAASADGNKLVVPDPYHNGVYASTNAGATWIYLSNSVSFGQFAPIASSADGNKLVVATGGGGPIYTSTNAGVTWTSSNVLGGIVVSVASSADGNKLVAVDNPSGPGGPIYTSTNAGVTWRSNSVPITNWSCVASSADGNKLVALSYNGQTYTTTNSGTSWEILNVSNIGWRTVDSSADGNKLVAGTYGQVAGPLVSLIYTSTNAGATWVSNNVPPVTGGYYYSVAASADGNKLVAVARYHGVFTSTNAGATWTSNNVSTYNSASVASSADGNTLVIAGGAIWVSQTIPTPTLSITPSPGNAVISWLIPSLNFTLQQNPDLTTPNWTDVTALPSLNLTNLQNEITLPMTPTNTFYRLKSSP